jgi:hypothetical protein
MTPDQIRRARAKLGLTQKQFAEMLDTDPTTARRMEMQPDAKTHRSPPARATRLIQAYLDGYRPKDWPVKNPTLNQDGKPNHSTKKRTTQSKG